MASKARDESEIREALVLNVFLLFYVLFPV